MSGLLHHLWPNNVHIALTMFGPTNISYFVFLTLLSLWGPHTRALLVSRQDTNKPKTSTKNPAKDAIHSSDKENKQRCQAMNRVDGDTLITTKEKGESYVSVGRMLLTI